MKDQFALTETTYYILLSPCKPRHGYGIMQKTEQLSNGRIRLAAGTLYAQGDLSAVRDQNTYSRVRTAFSFAVGQSRTAMACMV